MIDSEIFNISCHRRATGLQWWEDTNVKNCINQSHLGVLLAMKSHAQRMLGRVVKKTHEGQRRKDAIISIHTEHDPLSSISNKSKEMRNTKILHTHASSSDSLLGFSSVTKGQRIFIAHYEPYLYNASIQKRSIFYKKIFASIGFSFQNHFTKI